MNARLAGLVWLFASSAALAQSTSEGGPAPGVVKPARATKSVMVRRVSQQTPVTVHNAGEKGQAYKLSYRFAAGETIRTQIVHQVMVDTKIKGSEQTARTHSTSAKVWKIEAIDDQGNITLTHSVEYVQMTNSVDDQAEVRYDSRVDTDPPKGYEAVAQSLRVPLATIKIDPTGRILERKDEKFMFNPGIGDLTVPLPPTPVKIDAEWSVQDEIKLTDAKKLVHPVKVRQGYRLLKVATGVATIAVDTKVLTPLNDPQLESQLIQRLQKGEVKFDLDSGRLISRTMNLDENVIGFSGPDSAMKYVARFTEEPLRDAETAEAPAGPANTK